MERIYCVWIINRLSKGCGLIKAFKDSEKALDEKMKQEAILKQNAQSLKYYIVIDSIEVY